MNPAIGLLDCPACDYQAEVRESKRGKVYIVCDECGYQGFSRGPSSDQAMRARMQPLADDPPAQEPQATLDPEPEPREIDTGLFW